MEVARDFSQYQSKTNYQKEKNVGWGFGSVHQLAQCVLAIDCK